MQPKNHQTIFSIETSCDESSVAIISTQQSGESIMCHTHSHLIASQAELHATFGGVFPAIAKKEHAKNLPLIIEQSLSDYHVPLRTQKKSWWARIKSMITYYRVRNILRRESDMFQHLWRITESHEKPDITHIAVTYGPGLTPALWTGIQCAKALSLIWNIPLIPVHHMKGHIWSIFATDIDFTITRPEFPLLTLLVSGGHTQLVLVKDFDDIELLGETRDDAVGEAFDKVARTLGLAYPGGPNVERLAETAGDIPASLRLPRPMINTKTYEFSFSGLKTAVQIMYDREPHASAVIAKEFQQAITDVLIEKTKQALVEFHPSRLIIAGGVSANNVIRSAFENLCKEHNVQLELPPRNLTGDNALMIGVAGIVKYYVYGNRAYHHNPVAVSRVPYNRDYPLLDSTV